MEKNNYEVDPKFKLEFTPQQFSECEIIFKSIDTNKDGIISRSELLTALHSQGYRNTTNEDVDKIIADLDLNDDKQVQFVEYLKMMKKFFNEKDLSVSKKTTKLGHNILQVKSGENSTNDTNFSSFSEEERTAYVKVINTVLKDDVHCSKLLPIDPDSMEVFTRLKNGILLCKLINKAHSGTIDERVINTKDNINIFGMTDNLKLGINAAKSIGCQIITIYPDTFLEERYVLILGVLWQIIKMIVLGELNLKSHPQLIRLLKENEQLGDLLKLNPEDLLLRWFNYHLTNAGYDKPITNFTSDIKDSEKYTILLNQLNGTLCDKSALNESDLTKRAAKVLENSKNLGVDSYITAKDITSGNNKLNILFTAAIFNHCHGLDPPTEEEAYEAAKLLQDDIEGTREERAFRMWINSLGIPDLYINNLYEESKSGVLLLKVIDKVKPGSVEWKKVDQTSTNKFKKLINCNEAVDASKKCGFSVVGIGGSDILDGNKKYILAIVWQLMRAHTLQVIGNKTEDDLIKWANDLINKEPRIANLKDKSLKNSLFFINIMNAIEPRAINWEIVHQEDDSAEALENNAKYAISIARKLGASIFLTWEDIKEVKSKMLMTFLAGLYDVFVLESKNKNKNKGQQDVNLGYE